MKLASSLILVVAFAFVSSQSPTTSSVSPATGTTATVTDTTVLSTRQPDTTSSTEETTIVKSTTASPDTTTPSPKPTTTPSPDTTTPSPKPTTTPPPDTTTSPSPQPTTPPPVTTTKSPEPPTPVDGSWNVTDGNLTCIRADLKVRFRINVKDRVEYILLNPNATSSGSCKLTATTQELQLDESEYTLVMTFEKDSTNAYLKNVTFTYMLPDSSGIVYNDTKLFSVKVGNSYMCDSSNNVILSENITMEVFRIHIQSFGSEGNKDFGTAEECEADNKVNDMVPIAVGIALLVLVVVVLIAYFVGRRRSRQKGYQSV